MSLMHNVFPHKLHTRRTPFYSKIRRLFARGLRSILTFTHPLRFFWKQ